MSWLAFFANVGAALGFVVAALVWSRRIGGPGPWLLAVVGLVDAFIIVAFRAYFVVRSDDPDLFGRSLTLLEFADVVLTYFAGIVAVVGFGTMMPKTRR